MAAEQIHTRYARQTVLKEIGEAGQRMIGVSTAVVVGIGALGANSANLLARAGVGVLRLVDRDVVDWTNLQRQSLFDEEDVARSLPKAEAAAQRLRGVNSSIRCEPVTDDINASNVERIVAGASVVVDGLDNFHTRALVNQACVKLSVPWIYGACLGTFGNAATIIPGVSACLNCLLPDVAEATTPPLSCETVGVLGPVAALVAAWQSAEAIKIMVGRRDASSLNLVHVDLWNNDFSALPIARDANCAVCGQRKFDLLSRADRLATATLCGRDAVQIVPPASFSVDFDLLRETLGRIFSLEENPFLIKFRADDHDVVVFRGGRAMVFGVTDPKAALSLYGKYIGG